MWKDNLRTIQKQDTSFLQQGRTTICCYEAANKNDVLEFVELFKYNFCGQFGEATKMKGRDIEQKEMVNLFYKKRIK